MHVKETQLPNYFQSKDFDNLLHALGAFNSDLERTLRPIPDLSQSHLNRSLFTPEHLSSLN